MTTYALRAAAVKIIIIFIKCKNVYFYGHCTEGIGCHNVKMSFYISICLSISHVPFSRPLIGQKWECFIVEEVIDVDELDKGYLILAATGKQGN